ncbi:MAG: aliphatic sulfonates ABC transporter substrate-binding protein, partial [Acinetobacter baumannii]|nr:aliphatic sulfonates ABC transporter substrate-binding protein [Acinetobacter baumannii]
MSLKSKFSLPKTLLASTLGFVFASSTFAAIPTTLKLDYAYYAPTSLV